MGISLDTGPSARTGPLVLSPRAALPTSPLCGLLSSERETEGSGLRPVEARGHGTNAEPVGRVGVGEVAGPEWGGGQSRPTCCTRRSGGGAEQGPLHSLDGAGKRPTSARWGPPACPLSPREESWEPALPAR